MWPDPSSFPEGEDLVAVGADLSPDVVLSAYRHGLFPMHVTDDLGRSVLGWWSPDPRGILEDMRITRSLRTSAKRYRVTWDAAFTDVMRACADPARDQGWITQEFIDTYGQLHRAGFAHSVEVWNRSDELVGGLYGVSIGGLFAGESMFHRERDASKVALIELVAHVHQRSGALLDVQWVTDHLASLGAIAVPRAEYLERLRVALAMEKFSVPSSRSE